MAGRVELSGDDPRRQTGVGGEHLVGADQRETVAEHDDDLGGIGFLPDGRLLLVAQNERRVLRLDGDRLVVHADLSSAAGVRISDMIVASDGSAYVGDRNVETVETEDQVRQAVTRLQDHLIKLLDEGVKIVLE